MKHTLRVCVPLCIGAHECDESKTVKISAFLGSIPKFVKVGDVGIYRLSWKDIHLVCNYQNKRTLETRYVLVAARQLVITYTVSAAKDLNILCFFLSTHPFHASTLLSARIYLKV